MSEPKPPQPIEAKPVIKKAVDVDEQYVLDQYQKKIDYYWAASRRNKKAYKRVRFWTVFLGSLITLVSSISAADFVQSTDWVRITFAIATPILAASLAIIGGLGQSFHWGSTWRDMVVNATRLEKERDRFSATKRERRNLQKELDILNTIILDETKNFFQRVLDSEVRPRESTTTSPR